MATSKNLPIVILFALGSACIAASAFAQELREVAPNLPDCWKKSEKTMFGWPFPGQMPDMDFPPERNRTPEGIACAKSYKQVRAHYEKMNQKLIVALTTNGDAGSLVREGAYPAVVENGKFVVKASADMLATAVKKAGTEPFRRPHEKNYFLLLSEFGVSPDAVTSDGKTTPLIIAASTCNWDVIEQFVDRQGNPDFVPPKSSTGLSALQTIERVIKEGTAVNKQHCSIAHSFLAEASAQRRLNAWNNGSVWHRLRDTAAQQWTELKALGARVSTGVAKVIPAGGGPISERDAIHALKDFDDGR
jgi:hypothetical protein